VVISQGDWHKLHPLARGDLLMLAANLPGDV
jgi:hypothetical protein